MRCFRSDHKAKRPMLRLGREGEAGRKILPNRSFAIGSISKGATSLAQLSRDDSWRCESSALSIPSASYDSLHKGFEAGRRPTEQPA